MKGLTTLPTPTLALQSRYFEHMAVHLHFPFGASYWNHNDPIHTFREVTVIALLDKTRITNGDGILCEAHEGRQVIELPLSDVLVDSEHPDFQLLDDYSWWMLLAGHEDWDELDFVCGQEEPNK